MIGDVVGPGQVSGGWASESGCCCWPIGCLGHGQAWLGGVRAAVARAALWPPGWIGSQPGALAAGCRGLWWQGVSSACDPGVVQEITLPWRYAGTPPAGGPSGSCCVARGVFGVLRVLALLVLPESVRRRRWGDPIRVFLG